MRTAAVPLVETVMGELLAQGTATDAQDGGCLGLIAPGVVHHCLHQGTFDLVKHHLIQPLGGMAVQMVKVVSQRVPHAIAQGLGAFLLSDCQAVRETCCFLLRYQHLHAAISPLWSIDQKNL